MAWGPWLMDLRRDWLGEPAKHLRWSSTVFGLAQTVENSRLVAFPYDLSFSGPEGPADADGPRGDKRRWTTIAGALWTRRANRGGDPSTMGPTPTPNPRDGAGRDAAFRTKPVQKAYNLPRRNIKGVQRPNVGCVEIMARLTSALCRIRWQITRD